jgi:hypothetical protein
LLREQSMESALAHFNHSEDIPRANVQLARKLGLRKMQSLLEKAIKLNNDWEYYLVYFSLSSPYFLFLARIIKIQFLYASAQSSAGTKRTFRSNAWKRDC